MTAPTSQPPAATGPRAPEPAAPRRYRSTRRAAQAAQTRGDVVAAAVRLFEATGWTGTTVAAIAREAGVAVETVYAGFGSKKGLLRAAMEAGVVGDAEPVPFSERDAARSMGRGSTAERLGAAAAVVADIHGRTAGIWRGLLEAASSDDEVATWRDELEAGRRVEVGRSVEAIAGRAPDDVELDLLWLLYGPETYTKLVRDSGWAVERYRAFLVEVTARVLGLAV